MDKLVYLGAYAEAVFPMKKTTTPWKACPNKACISSNQYQRNTKFCCDCGSEVVVIQKETTQKRNAYEIIGYRLKLDLGGEWSDSINQAHCWVPKETSDVCVSRFDPASMDDFIQPIEFDVEMANETEVFRIKDQIDNLAALPDFEYLKQAYAKVDGKVDVRWGLLFWNY